MRQKSMTIKDTAEKAVRDIRRKTRKQYSAEEKIRVVLEGLRGEESIAALCRREGIAESLYYSWSKEFLEADKKRLAGDTSRQATSVEVKGLRSEMRDMKELVADLTLENRLLKKSMLGDGGDEE
jgi:transposase